MPVTLKLSKKFYDTFGEQVTSEFVDAFNQVDATYRSDLKEMNESNFARFDAKLDTRFAQFEARFAQFEGKMEARLAQFEGKMEARLAQFEGKMEARLAQFEVQMERGFNAQSRFILLGNATLLAAIVAGMLLK